MKKKIAAALLCSMALTVSATGTTALVNAETQMAEQTAFGGPGGQMGGGPGGMGGGFGGPGFGG